MKLENMVTVCLDAEFSTTRRVVEHSHALNNALSSTSTENICCHGGLRTQELYKTTYVGKPLISIVTVVYNCEDYMEESIRSVIGQTYDNVEYIIIDGGSTDATLSIIKQHASQIDCWVSEKDEGIYDAMNKGAALATGEYVAFLNADDWYELSTIEDVADAIKKDPDLVYVFGNIGVSDNGIQKKIVYPRLKKYKTKIPFGHPTLFLRREVFQKYEFSHEYKVISDYDLIIKLITNKYKHAYIDKKLTNFRVGGISTQERVYDEHFRLFREHFGLFHAVLYIVRKYIRAPQRQLRKVARLFRSS